MTTLLIYAVLIFWILTMAGFMLPLVAAAPLLAKIGLYGLFGSMIAFCLAGAYDSFN